MATRYIHWLIQFLIFSHWLKRCPLGFPKEKVDSPLSKDPLRLRTLVVSRTVRARCLAESHSHPSSHSFFAKALRVLWHRLHPVNRSAALSTDTFLFDLQVLLFLPRPDLFVQSPPRSRTARENEATEGCPMTDTTPPRGMTRRRRLRTAQPRALMTLLQSI